MYCHGIMCGHGDDYVYAGDGFFANNIIRFGEKKMAEFAKEFELYRISAVSTGIDEYQLKRFNRILIIKKHWIEESIHAQHIHYRSIPTPSKIRDKLFHHQYMQLEDALNRTLTCHKNTVLRPISRGNQYEVGQFSPAFDFDIVNQVDDIQRERCPFIIKTSCNDIHASLPMGSGKTHGLRELIQKRNYKRILVVVPRRSLGRDMIKSLNSTMGDYDVKFKYYLDNKDKMNRDAINANRLVCSIDSLELFVPVMNDFEEFDLIVMDEAVTIMNHFGAPFFKQARKGMALLKRLCTKATHMVVLDADLDKSEQVVSFLRDACRRNSITKIQSSAKTDNNLYLQLSADDDFYLRVKELLQKGLRVVVMSNLKKEVESIHIRLRKDFPNKKGAAIYNDEGHKFNDYLFQGETKKRAFNTKEDTKNLHWFAFSPSISPGVSITDPFDVLCAHAMASEKTAPLLYWNQLLNRVRILTKQLVLFKIETVGVKRLSMKIEDIKKDYINRTTWLSSADLDVSYEDSVEMVSSSWSMNCVYIEQNLRYCGYFEQYFKKWRKALGAEFDYLQMNAPIEVSKVSKKQSKIIQAQSRNDTISRIIDAPILSRVEYENSKNQITDAGNRYAYCFFNGIQQAKSQSHNLQLKSHMIQYYKKDDHIKYFCYMLFDKEDSQDNSFTSFNPQRHLFNEMIKVLGFKSFRDESVFSEHNGDTINEDAVKELMEKVKKNERFATELELKKAKGIPYVWIKYAFNAMGRKLGITNRSIKLMVGNKKYRKWSIRGISKTNENLFSDNLELAYMRCNKHRRIKESEMKQSIETYSRWKNGEVRILLVDVSLSNSKIAQIHKEQLEKYTKRNYEGDAQLFETRSHHWDALTEEYEEEIKTIWFWSEKYECINLRRTHIHM